MASESEALRCTVITPEAQVYDGRAELVVLPAHDGQIGILRNRAPLMCKLGFGRLRVRHADDEESWYIDAGFAEVIDNVVTVLTPRALRPEQIDQAAATADLDQARRMLVSDEIGERHRQEAIARARAQLRVAIW